MQIAAIETTGLLRNQEAVPDLIGCAQRARRTTKFGGRRCWRIAMLPDRTEPRLFTQYSPTRTTRCARAAAEGFARLRNPADLPVLEKAWQGKSKTSPRLSLAFAQVMLGQTEFSEFSPLQYLINNLNSKLYKGEAEPFLMELARDERVRNSLYRAMSSGTKDEKIGLARVLARSGDKESLAVSGEVE